MYPAVRAAYAIARESDKANVMRLDQLLRSPLFLADLSTPTTKPDDFSTRYFAISDIDLADEIATSDSTTHVENHIFGCMLDVLMYANPSGIKFPKLNDEFDIQRLRLMNNMGMSGIESAIRRAKVEGAFSRISDQKKANRFESLLLDFYSELFYNVLFPASITCGFDAHPLITSAVDALELGAVPCGWKLEHDNDDYSSTMTGQLCVFTP
jgi:hypothetical protein